MPSGPHPLYTVHHGDARSLAKLLDRVARPNEPPLTCTITSPPYGSLKDYGHPDQIGWGQPYDEYLVEMRSIFRSIYQYTRLDGSMWIIADTLRADEAKHADLPSQMEPLPFQLAQQASEAGWILREVVIWQKQKTLPWSSGRRLRNVFEYVLLFVKSSQYKFHTDRLRDPENLEEWWVKWPERYNPNGKMPTNVWEIPIPQQGTWSTSAIQHACPLPPDLVERLILLSTDEDDLVLDPFAGTGVVVAEAERLGRRAMGIELNKRYVKAYKTVVRPEIQARSANDDLQRRIQKAEELRGRIIRLRAMKYPKVLWQQLMKDGQCPLPQLVVALSAEITASTMADPTKPLPIKVFFAYDTDDRQVLDVVERRLKNIANRPPATKFGIAGDVAVVSIHDISDYLGQEPLYLYEAGRTWQTVGSLKSAELGGLRPSKPARRNSHPYPPIVGNLEVNEVPGRRPDGGLGS